MKKLILFITLCRVLINLSKSDTVHYKETIQQMNDVRNQLFTLLIANNL